MDRKEYQKKWRENNKEKSHICYRNWYTNLKKKVLQKLARGGKICCRRCGSEDLSWLEVNHINGGGRKEYKIKSGVGLYQAIVRGTRKIDDLEILCRPCNLVDAAERMSGRKYIIVS